jgi:hypothetical protein
MGQLLKPTSPSIGLPWYLWCLSHVVLTFCCTLQDHTIYRACRGSHDLSCLSRITRFIMPLEDHTIYRASRGSHDVSWRSLQLIASISSVSLLKFSRVFLPVVQVPQLVFVCLGFISRLFLLNKHLVPVQSNLGPTNLNT